jgi:hypothetical protein
VVVLFLVRAPPPPPPPPKDRMRAGGFGHYAIMHIDNSTQQTIKYKPQVPPYYCRRVRYTNTMIMAKFQFSNKGSGRWTRNKTTTWSGLGKRAI